MEYVPYIAIACAYALIYLPRYIVGGEMKKLEGGYNNSDPRSQQALLEGRGKRALGAHNNGFEAFGPFGVAILAAVQRGANLKVIDACAVAFVVVRTIYVFAYVGDRPSVRSAVWSLGIAATGLLMILAIVGPHW
jgi:uncharacterized MAPEG superfamily protein